MELQPERNQSNPAETASQPNEANGTSATLTKANAQPEAAKPLPIASFPNQPSGFYKTLPATLDNVQYLLKSYGIEARFDVIKKKIVAKIPGLDAESENADASALTTILSLSALNNIPIGPVPALVEALADSNSVNPAAEWINSKPWDGRDRLPEICKTLVVREGYPELLRNILTRKWLLSAVAAALMPKGFKARGVLTLQGPQGIGKTSWLRALINDPALSEALIKVDHLLDPHNKDSVIGAITHWMVEIGELDSSLRRSDVARLKGVLTSDSDKVRRPYAKVESEYRRRTVFAATVNEHNFLVDHTGNTRFWTLALAKIDYAHGIDMQQVFAQLSDEWRKGQQWWLTPEEEDLLNALNLEHRTVSLMRNRLLEAVDFDKAGMPGGKRLSTTDILHRLGYEKPTNGDNKELTGILRELVGEGARVKGYQTWQLHWNEPAIRQSTCRDLP